jgi:hypothetical protein
VATARFAAAPEITRPECAQSARSRIFRPNLSATGQPYPPSHPGPLSQLISINLQTQAITAFAPGSPFGHLAHLKRCLFGQPSGRPVFCA